MGIAKKRLAVGLGVVVLGLMLGVVGCSARTSQAATKGATQAPSIVGLWTIDSAKGKAASLSEIGFTPDGVFTHTGNNALGRPVAFRGFYQVGQSGDAPVVKLTYDDFPDRPTTWFFRIDGDILAVAPSVADLGTEKALEFHRQQQQ